MNELGKTTGSGRNIEQVEFLRWRLSALQNDRNLSVRVDGLRKRTASSEEQRFDLPIMDLMSKGLFQAEGAS